MPFPMASMPPMQYAPPAQPFGYPSQPWQPWPQPSALAPKFKPPAPQQPVLAAQASAAQPQPPQAIIRMQAPETTPAPRLVMPSPEALGLTLPIVQTPAAQPKEVDLNTAFARLRQLGALGLHLDKLTQGGYRATFVLPGQQGPQEVEADGATEGTALAAALERAEHWMARK